MLTWLNGFITCTVIAAIVVFNAYVVIGEIQGYQITIVNLVFAGCGWILGYLKGE